ncbi:aminoglycoside phosphotransferase (APT) family kinase protein [Pseudomonas sp. 3400]|nr:aminoglycoside phosphotransferase (APT) family kinase protein [Pseudomonas sp. 3400]MDR7013478.1 aminoglycoside phosphotransferase (APT) family kinase protein [Pseudomonas alcaliphila]
MANPANIEFISVLTKAAASIVAELLGANVLTVEFLHQGMMTYKCRVYTKDEGDVIVRFYPPGRSDLVNVEPDLLMRCHRAGIPVPQPIGDSRSGVSSPLNYVAYRRIDGETVAERLGDFDRARRHVLAEDLALHLYRLQSLAFEGAGELVSSVVAKSDSWSSFSKQSMQVGLEAIKRHKLLDQGMVGEIERVISSDLPVPERAMHQLVWGDINFGNILVRADGHVAALIDFEGCMSGDPLATLGYAAAVHGADPFFSELQAVWPGSLSVDDENLIAWYALLRALRLAPFAHLPLPTGLARDPLVRIVPGIIPALRQIAASF